MGVSRAKNPRSTLGAPGRILSAVDRTVLRSRGACWKATERFQKPPLYPGRDREPLQPRMGPEAHKKING